eukprot:gene4789-5039_t
MAFCAIAAWGKNHSVVSRVATPKLASTEDSKRDVSAIEGPSTDLSVIYGRLQRLVLPYWIECPSARWRLAGVVGLTLATTGVSVTFNYLGRDFFNALSEKDVEGFRFQLIKYLCGFCVGIPVYVLKQYYQARLALEWREWMTAHLLGQYFADRSFYQLRAGALVDNPDQRIAADVRQFTDAALGLSLTVLNSLIDLVSFSGILYSIYPPLFGALLAYSIGGTLGSIALGKSLVGLNFNQEAVEADMRYSLVRVRENAESIAFYGGQTNEMAALLERLQAVVANYGKLLVASRNLDFFTSFYRYLIQLLPAAVVAPLFFAGKIEFGVITQSSSAFSHILNDVSLVVYQFENLAGFSAVVDRLGEFQEVVDVKLRHTHPRSQLNSSMDDASGAGQDVLLELDDVSIITPDGALALVQRLSLQVYAGQNLLIMGPSGGGKTSVLRTLAGLWQSGEGTIYSYGLRGIGDPGVGTENGSSSVLFLPQRPYMVLGSLRDQLLYPTWTQQLQAAADGYSSSGTGSSNRPHKRPVPTDQQLEAVLELVQLSSLIQRCKAASAAQAAAAKSHHASEGMAAPVGGNGISSAGPSAHPEGVRSLAADVSAFGPGSLHAALSYVADWSGMLSLGEQQRLAFARLLLAAPTLALLDEATSALDTTNEALLYKALKDSGTTVISVGHRPTLVAFHSHVLQLGHNDKLTPAGNWRLLPAEQVRHAMG